MSVGDCGCQRQTVSSTATMGLAGEALNSGEEGCIAKGDDEMEDVEEVCEGECIDAWEMEASFKVHN